MNPEVNFGANSGQVQEFLALTVSEGIRYNDSCYPFPRRIHVTYFHVLRSWRNRQTRTFEGRVGNRTSSSLVDRTNFTPESQRFRGFVLPAIQKSVQTFSSKKLRYRFIPVISLLKLPQFILIIAQVRDFLNTGGLIICAIRIKHHYIRSDSVSSIKIHS